VTEKITLTLFMFIGLVTFAFGEGNISSRFKVEKSLDIAEVPADFPVGFCLLTVGKHQYVAYYDKDRNMTVASRTVGSDKWRYQVLPSKVGWDSHACVGEHALCTADLLSHGEVGGNYDSQETSHDRQG
jgi:hypothetical protein